MIVEPEGLKRISGEGSTVVKASAHRLQGERRAPGLPVWATDPPRFLFVAHDSHLGLTIDVPVQGGLGPLGAHRAGPAGALHRVAPTYSAAARAVRASAM